MTRRWHAITLAVLAIAIVTTAASAQHGRRAKVGDRIGALLTGLTAVNGGSVGSCTNGAPALGYIQYLVPARLGNATLLGLLGKYEDDNAAFLGLTIGTRTVMLVAFDEANPNVPATVYADLDGKGLITNVWPADQAPALCALMQQLHYQP